MAWWDVINSVFSAMGGGSGTLSDVDNEDIYYDSVNGEAGTAWPIGTAKHPVNNLADAKTIMAARNSPRLKLSGDTGSITFDSDTVVNLIGNEGYDIYVGAFTVAFLGHVTCASLTNAGTLSIGSLDCKGPLDNTGATSLTINGDAFVKGLITNTTGEIAVYGGLAGAGNIATTTGNILVGGNIFISGSIIGTGTGDFTIGGDAYIGSLIQNDAGGEITISGNCHVSMTISNNDAASIFTVVGDLEVGGAITNLGGTMTLGSLDAKSTLDNTGAVSLIVNGDCFIVGAVTNTTGAITVYGNYRGAGNISTTTGNIAVNGDFYTDGSMTSTNTGDYTIGGDVKIAGNITNSGGGRCDITGSLSCGGSVDNTGGDVISVGRNTYISGLFTNTTASVYFYGECHLGGNVSTDTGHITISGNCDMLGSYIVGTTGDLDVYGNLTVTGGAVNIAQGDFIIRGDCIITSSSLSISTGFAEIWGNLTISITDIWITGAGTLKVYKDAYIKRDISNVGTFTVYGGVICTNTITNTGTMAFGSLNLGSTLNNTGAVSLTVHGDCFIGGTLTNTTGAITVNNGSIRIQGALSGGAGNINFNNCNELDITLNYTGSGNHLFQCRSINFHGSITQSGTFSLHGEIYVYGNFTFSGAGGCNIYGNLSMETGELANTGNSAFNIYGNATIEGNVSATGTSTYGFNGDLTVLSGNLTGATGQIEVYGDCRVGYSITVQNGMFQVYGKLYVTNNFTRSGTGATYLRDVEIQYDFTVSAIATVEIYGNFYIGHNFTVSSTGTVNIGGNTYINGNVTSDTGGTVALKGDCYIGGNLSNNNAGSSFTVTGIAKLQGSITNAGTLSADDLLPHRRSKDLVAANLTGTVTRFTVTGAVRIKSLGLDVTTAIAAGANTLKFSFTPVGGAATDLCGTSDTASAVVNQLMMVDGVKATALVLATDPGIAIESALHMPIVLKQGVIQTIFSAGPPATGAGKVFVDWEPIEDGAIVY